MSSPTDATSASAAGSTHRRSSSGNSGLFSNLMAQKRSADNTAYSQRRQSIEDQGAKQGVLGNMWNNVIKGVGPTDSSK